MLAGWLHRTNGCRGEGFMDWLGVKQQIANYCEYEVLILIGCKLCELANYNFIGC